MEPKKSTNPDWASLPPDLVYLITRKLSDLPDFIHFRAVCKHWLASAPISDPPLEFPWILEQSTYLPSHLRFFCPSTGKVFTLPLPPQLHNLCRGPSHDGYLLFDHRWCCSSFPNKIRSLFNPLTNHLVNLPFLDEPLCSHQTSYRRGDYAVVSSTLCGSTNLAFFRLGNKKWSRIWGRENEYCCLGPDGMFFSFNGRIGETTIVDMATNDKISVIQSPRQEKDACLIESFGEILRVVMLNCSSHHIQFRIYKLTVHFDDGKLNLSWVQTDSIGDCVLFLSEKSGVSLKASQFYGSLRNCIYFRNVLKNGGSAICRYSIKDGKVEETPCIFKNWHFFVPNLHYPNSSGS